MNIFFAIFNQYLGVSLKMQHTGTDSL